MTRRDTEDDYWWLMTDYWLSSHGQHGWNGGPQADGGGERKLKRINRELKEMGPQADGGGEQVLINDERLLIGDDRLFAPCLLLEELIKLRKFLMIDGVHTENAEDADNSRIWQSEFIEPT